ncbi:MAG: AraC family transcriptional regulator, partial [Mesorhizobium sp.]
MAVAHGFGRSVDFDFHGAAKTPALMYRHDLHPSLSSTALERPTKDATQHQCGFKASGNERNDAASASLDSASGTRMGCRAGLPRNLRMAGDGMAGDALSDLLKTVRLTGATFFDIAAQDPWAVCSPSPSSILPRILPGADHLISYHVLTAGR